MKIVCFWRSLKSSKIRLRRIHITTEQRYTIWRMQDQGFSQVKIGQAIEKHKSVICRELTRNSDARSGEYRYELAVKKHANHQKGKRKHLRFTDAIKESVELLLQDDYSPEQVVGFKKKENRSVGGSL